MLIIKHSGRKAIHTARSAKNASEASGGLAGGASRKENGRYRQDTYVSLREFLL